MCRVPGTGVFRILDRPFWLLLVYLCGGTMGVFVWWRLLNTKTSHDSPYSSLYSLTHYPLCRSPLNQSSLSRPLHCKLVSRFILRQPPPNRDRLKCRYVSGYYTSPVTHSPRSTRPRVSLSLCHRPPPTSFPSLSSNGSRTQLSPICLPLQTEKVEIVT